MGLCTVRKPFYQHINSIEYQKNRFISILLGKESNTRSTRIPTASENNDTLDFHRFFKDFPL